MISNENLTVLHFAMIITIHPLRATKQIHFVQQKSKESDFSRKSKNLINFVNFKQSITLGFCKNPKITVLVKELITSLRLSIKIKWFSFSKNIPKTVNIVFSFSRKRKQKLHFWGKFFKLDQEISINLIKPFKIKFWK